MRDKWIVIVAAAVLGTIGYVYWKDKQNQSQQGSTLPGGQLNIESPSLSSVSSSIGSYVDPTGGMNYVDAVPVSQTSPTGFTAQDYNYGTVNENPISSVGGYDIVQTPGGSGTGLVPTGINSLLSYSSVVG